MTTPSPSLPRCRPWLRLAGLVPLALVVASSWKMALQYQAANELRAAGFWPGRADLWQVARDDWRDLLKRETWQVDRGAVLLGSGQTAQIRNFDAVAPALHRLKIESIIIEDCPLLQNVDALQGLRTLTTLSLFRCPTLQNVDGLKGLTALRELEILDCDALGNLDALHGLTGLERIIIVGRAKLSAEAIAALKAALPDTQIRAEIGTD